MLPINHEYLSSKLKRMRDCRHTIQEQSELDPDRVQSLLQDLLEAFIEITEHLCSRMENSKSPTYRDRVRQLADEGILETTYVEEQLVRLAWFYENRVGLHIPLKNSEIKEIREEQLSQLGPFEQAVESIIEQNKD